MSNLVRSLTWAGVGLAALFGFTVSGAQAAPQALALVATNGDVPLKCVDGTCSAEMSAFCLQPDRVTPIRGTKYTAIDSSKITLKGMTRDGREIVLDSSKFVSFQSERTHVAIRANVAAEEMAALGVDRLRLNVGNDVAMLPDPEANDTNPHSQIDVLVITGSLRKLGARVVDRNRKHMIAARLTSRIINELPAKGWVTAEQSEAIWQGTVDAVNGQNLPEDAVGMARRAIDFCNFAVNSRVYWGMRRCLQSEHDVMLKILNSQYWTAVKTGS